jgi:exodeoxyribonuclease V
VKDDSSFRDVLHDQLFDALRQRFGDELERHVQTSREALADLRAAYSAGRPPPFHRGAVRLAYVLGFHPAHVLASWWALDAMGPTALGLEREHLNVVCLGAGPGAEVVGLMHFAAQRLPALRGVTVHLIDREQGWGEPRAATMSGLAQLVDGVDVQLREHWMDLTDAGDLAGIEQLIRDADLITVQTVLTELVVEEDRRALLNALGDWLGPDARLLVMDLHRLSRGASALAATSELAGLRTIWECSQVLALGSPPSLLAQHFWSSRDGQIARKTVQVTARLLGRPGMASIFVGDETEPTASQRRVLEAFPEFLDGDTRLAVLTGRAGTGKTTLARKLAKLATDKGFEVKLLAPTGQAARRIGQRVGATASTIHSAIYEFDETKSDAEGRPNTTFSARPPALTPALWIVDEASMVGNLPYSDRESEVDPSLLFAKGNLLDDLVTFTLNHPGSRLLMIGDREQLPPVEDQVRAGLDVPTLQAVSGQEPVAWELVEVTRQVEDSPIHHLAMAALAGAELEIPPGQSAVAALTNGQLEDPLRREVLSGAAAVIVYANARVAEWNCDIREAEGRWWEVPMTGDRLLVCQNAPWVGLLNGDEVEVLDVRTPVNVRARPPRGGDDLWITLVPLVVGIDVPPIGRRRLETFVVHDLLPAMRPEMAKYVNHALRIDLISRSEDGDGENVRPGHNSWSRVAMNDDRYTALRATYAYARTAHRAQGSEWNRVAVDTEGVGGGSEGASWRYTAFTRARAGLHVAGLATRLWLAPGDLLRIVRDELTSKGYADTDCTTCEEHHVQIGVSRDGEDGIVDAYAAHALPSRATKRKGGKHTTRVARLVNDRFREVRQELQPLLPNTAVWFDAQLRPHLVQQGLTCAAWRNGNMQVTVEAVDQDGREARVLIHHDLGGYPSTSDDARPVSPDGDRVARTLQRVVKEVLGRQP